MPKFDPTTNIVLSNVIPMADDNSVGVTSHAATTADAGILGQIGKLQTASGIVYGAFPYPFTATTNASGVATICLMDDGTYGQEFVGDNNCQPIE